MLECVKCMRYKKTPHLPKHLRVYFWVGGALLIVQVLKLTKGYVITGV